MEFDIQSIIQAAIAITSVIIAGAGVISGAWVARLSRESDRLRGRVRIEQKKVSNPNESSSLSGLDHTAFLPSGTNSAEQTDPRLDLLERYHAQGLLQSQISFWFSIIFAGLGFAIIALGAISALNADATAAKAAVPIISGAVIDAVAGLFFVQSNRARQLMSEFFDKLRTDNNLTEGLRLAESISDPSVASSLKAYLSMHFAGIDVGVDAFRSVVGLPVKLGVAASPSATPKPRHQKLPVPQVLKSQAEPT